jgi:hypothetical protein
LRLPRAFAESQCANLVLRRDSESASFWFECRRGAKTESARFPSATRDACISQRRRLGCVAVSLCRCVAVSVQGWDRVTSRHIKRHIKRRARDMVVSSPDEDFSEEARKSQCKRRTMDQDSFKSRARENLDGGARDSVPPSAALFRVLGRVRLTRRQTVSPSPLSIFTCDSTLPFTVRGTSDTLSV